MDLLDVLVEVLQTFVLPLPDSLACGSYLFGELREKLVLVEMTEQLVDDENESLLEQLVVKSLLLPCLKSRIRHYF